MTHIEMTSRIREALAAIATADAEFVPGRDSYSVVELPRLALAEAVLAAIVEQEADR